MYTKEQQLLKIKAPKISTNDLEHSLNGVCNV